MSYLLDARSVALRLGVRTLQVKKMAEAGQIPHFVLPDGTIAFQPEDLEAWLAELKRPAHVAREAPPRAAEQTPGNGSRD